MNFYELVPLTKLASGSGSLVYSSELDLAIGSFVSAPLLRRECAAIVVAKVGKPAFQTKAVTKRYLEDYLLPERLIELSDFIASRYLCSRGEALSSIVATDFTKKRRVNADNVESVKTKPPLKLSPKQQEIFEKILATDDTKPHLIHGVTGSGKTEIYLQLVQEQLDKGKSAIILIPEIALTPQTNSRFVERFGEKVGLFHSNMLETERNHIWEQALRGELQVIIGPRSALFAPLPNLGIIIIDEAHDGSYKQDQTPRYNAISVATELVKASEAKLILGTATPLVEQYYKAKNGEYHLHSLPVRIDDGEMPDIEIIDMRNEYKLGNKSILSEKLQLEIKETLAQEKQVLLFLNRRGMSTFVSCRECGYVSKCPNCDLPLVFHYDDLSLRCHHCDYKKQPEVKCPDCGSLAIKYFGSGTQKIEQEIKRLFGDIRIVRMDSDSTDKRGSHAEMFETIKAGEADIIIGTQMITKGWDLADIALIGVISVDAILNQPDYLANERVFSLLTQVTGRTGRGKTLGKGVIQTYSPEQKVFDFVREHDFEGFYQNEIKERELLGYPPFAKLVKLLYNNADLEVAFEQIRTYRDEIENALTESEFLVTMSQPYASFIEKRNRLYRVEIVIKLSSFEQNTLSIIQKIIANKSGLVVDVEPYSLI